MHALESGSVEIVIKEGVLFDEARADRYFRAFSYNEELLLQEAQNLCGPANDWSFPVFVDGSVKPSTEVVDLELDFRNQALLSLQDRWGSGANTPSAPSLL